MSQVIILEPRKLSKSERRALQSMVNEWCANFDRGNRLCLPKDKPCIMIAETCARCLCKYFRESVLPDNPVLEAALTRKTVETKQCPVCEKAFAPVGNRSTYCSEECRAKGARKKEREKKRLQREKIRIENAG